VIEFITLEGQPVAETQTTQCPDLLDQIPDPETVRRMLAESVKRSDLLRSVLRLAIRKAAYQRSQASNEQEAHHVAG
jgi:hypothetical protein